MDSCRKRVLLIFGLLFVLAILFVPYRLTSVSYKRDFSTDLIWRTTAKQSGYMLLPRFLKSQKVKSSARDRDQRFYALNKKMLVAELGIIVFLGALDYFVLCALLRRTTR